MEYTLKLALQRAKREWLKYGAFNYRNVNDLWDVFSKIYYLREEDEKELFFKSMKKWLEKNYIFIPDFYALERN